MTSAIKATVEEYASPSLPSSAPFSQSRITQKIRSNQLKQHGSRPPTRETSPDPQVKSDADESMSSTTALDPESPPLQSTTPQTRRFQNPESITAETINAHTYTAEDPPLDIFIRTSGVTRLSDFMLWQCHEDTHIFFLECLWPEFDLWHFIPVLLEWQWRQKKQMEREGGARRRLKDRVE
jgi:ditrans,polycis-polyprenyl diphosphate synthase